MNHGRRELTQRERRQYPRHVDVGVAGKRVEKMRKDNSNNTAGNPVAEVWITIRADVEGHQEAKRRGHAESKRLDCTANIDLANSPSPRLPIEGDELR